MANTGPFTLLPRPPGVDDKRQWQQWFDRIHAILSGIPGIAWSVVDKTGSKLTDIQDRPHSDLQTIKVLDPTSADTVKDRHLSDAQGKVWQDHVEITDANPHGTDHSQLDSILGTGEYHLSQNENAEVTALDGVTAGIIAKTADATYSGRTITGTTAEVDVADGDGVAGNPVVSLPTVIVTPRSFGDGTNQTTFEADGTLKFEAGATVFTDLTSAITGVKVLGTGVSLNTTELTIDFTTASNLSDYGYLSYQMSHSWLAGSLIDPHIHWEQEYNVAPNLLMQYRWQVNGAAKTTAWTNYKCNTSVYTYTAGTLNQISDGAGITPGSYSISDIIQIRVFRDNANTSGLFAGADTYTGTLRITSVDIHYEIDTVGSRTEFTK